jgi:phosphate acyltransferase
MTVTVAVDAMGGDHGPTVTVPAALAFLDAAPNARVVLVGQPAALEAALANARPQLRERISVRAASEVVDMNEPPADALRRKKDSSMRVAINLVKEGGADACVSAGNTGALMAIARFVLKTLPGIDRPAIATFFPTRRGESVMLDLGANIECDADNLVQFALMGDVFARTALGLVQPTVGLLNVGEEELKGNDAVRAAAAKLRGGMTPIRFHGFVEGDDIAAGTVDVVVTDGFTGNVALKTAEGIAKLFSESLRASFRYSPLARIGYVFARGALKKLAARLDTRRYNGAMFLGLGGIAVKSHGSTDAFGFANAISVAIDLKLNGFLEKIRDELAQLNKVPVAQQSAAL